MKYARLTQEQLESLHLEFANFLAAQQIDKNQWEKLKLENKEIAEQELDVFSDLIWEGVLTNANYLEHFSKNHIFLFSFDAQTIETIVIKSLNQDIDFMQTSGLEWLSDSLFTEQVDIRTGSKPFSEDRNQELFNFIKQGAILSQGYLFKQISPLTKK